MRLWIIILGAALLVLAAVTALCLCGGDASIADRVSHFAFYWGCAGFLLALVALVTRRRHMALLSAALSTVHALPVALLWVPDADAPEITGSEERLNIVCANLYASNQRKPEALAKLEELDADVLILMEIGRDWRTALKPLSERYPHLLGTSGTIWLLSRHPLRHTASGETAREGRVSPSPMVEATVVLPRASLRIVGIHSTRPSGPAGIAQQKRQTADYMEAFAREGETRHRLLIGDFNTSPFSDVFRHIVRATGLRDAAKGHGYHPTWGPRLPAEPLLPWVGLPIDHALVSEGVKVEDRQLGEMPGADHRYQQITLRF